MLFIGFINCVAHVKPGQIGKDLSMVAMRDSKHLRDHFRDNALSWGGRAPTNITHLHRTIQPFSLAKWDSLVSVLSARLYTSLLSPWSFRCQRARQTSRTWTVFILKSDVQSNYHQEVCLSQDTCIKNHTSHLHLLVKRTVDGSNNEPRC